MGQRSKEILSQEDILMANKHIKKCPTSVAIREIQLKAMMTSDYTPIRQTKIKSIANTWVARMWSIRFLVHSWEDYRMVQPL